MKYKQRVSLQAIPFAEIHAKLIGSKNQARAGALLGVSSSTLIRYLCMLEAIDSRITYTWLREPSSVLNMETTYGSLYAKPWVPKQIALEDRPLDTILQKIKSSPSLHFAAISLGVMDRTLTKFMSRLNLGDEGLCFEHLKQKGIKTTTTVEGGPHTKRVKQYQAHELPPSGTVFDEAPNMAIKKIQMHAFSASVNPNPLFETNTDLSSSLPDSPPYFFSGDAHTTLTSLDTECSTTHPLPHFEDYYLSDLTPPNHSLSFFQHKPMDLEEPLIPNVTLQSTLRSD